MENKPLVSKIIGPVKSSFEHDFYTLFMSRWSLRKKLDIILKKYWVIFLHTTNIVKFKLGSSKIKIDGRDYYYASVLGSSDFQIMHTPYSKMLKLMNMPNDPTIIDIGANVGQSCLYYNYEFPQGRIISFEPVPIVFEALKKNVDGISAITSVNSAVGNKPGNMKMEFDPTDSFQSRIVTDVQDNRNLIDVSVTTLDQVMIDYNINKIDLLKIDVETFEKEVLLGAKSSLAKTRYIMLEISFEDNERYTISELLSLLYSPDYNYQLISYRNFLPHREGFMPIADFLFENINLRNK